VFNIIPLEACRTDLTGYLKNLGVSGSTGLSKNVLTEVEIILNRANIHSLWKEERTRMTTCPKHRYELTTHYQKLSPVCLYPMHHGERKKT